MEFDILGCDAGHESEVISWLGGRRTSAALLPEWTVGETSAECKSFWQPHKAECLILHKLPRLVIVLLNNLSWSSA